MKHFGYLLFIVSMFLFLACKDDAPTVVNATVVDKYTNEPLENVYVVIHFWNEDKGTYSFYSQIYTDEQGRFSFSEEEIKDFKITQLAKTGYINKHNTIYDFFENYEEGKINEAIIPLIPEDGVLALTTKNTTGLHDSLYLRVFSPVWSSEFGISLGRAPLDFPLIPYLLQDQSFTQYVPLASNQEVTIYWRNGPIITNAEINSAFRANIEILRNDTVFYTIEY